MKINKNYEVKFVFMLKYKNAITELNKIKVFQFGLKQSNRKTDVK